MSYIYRGIGDRGGGLGIGMMPVVGAGEFGAIRLVLVLGGGLEKSILSQFSGL